MNHGGDASRVSAVSGRASSFDIGGPEVHVSQSGCADERVPHDRAAIEPIRRELGTLAIATYNTKLDDDFEILTDDPKERAEIEAGMRAVEARIEGDMDPYKAASQMDTDEIIAFGELRSWLELFAECAYQSIGNRRVKNPRIWSLHDISVLNSHRG